MSKVLEIILLWSIVLMASSTFAQDKAKAHNLRRDADKEYRSRAYDKAEEAYRKADILDADEKSSFNLGNAIYNQERYEEAVSQYEKAASMMDDAERKAAAYYNLGNAHFNNKKYKESVGAFKRALKADPDDLQAKQNLLMALQALKMEQQQQPQPEQQQQNQQQQEQEQQDQQQQQQQQQPGSSNEDDQPQQQTSDTEQKLTKEQAMQLLEIIEEEDRKVQEKMRKRTGERSKNGKDW